LELGIYYSRKWVWRFSENMRIIKYYIVIYYRAKCYTSCFRKKKSKQKIFSFQKYAYLQFCKILILI
jgi:hypothetical protein